MLTSAVRSNMEECIKTEVSVDCKSEEMGDMKPQKSSLTDLLEESKKGRRGSVQFALVDDIQEYNVGRREEDNSDKEDNDEEDEFGDM